MKGLFHDRGLIILLGGVVLAAVILVAIVLIRQFGSSYQQILPPDAIVRTDYLSDEETFNLRKIVVRKNNASCGGLEVSRNGDAKILDCVGSIQTRTVISEELINRLFKNLSLDKFQNLAGKYYLAGLDGDITLIIETTAGTKIVVVTGNDDTSPPLDDDIGDIIDTIDEVEEEIENNTPTPPPLTPTPTPPPGSGPTPTPTPVPTPAPPGSSPTPHPSSEPFNCDQLLEQGVTVSNTHCIDEE